MDTIKELRNYIPRNLFSEEGTNQIRRPHFDVGEFLPGMEESQREIVRMSLASTTGDVISIRASKEGYVFRIFIVDEYQTEFIEFKDEFDKTPTQGEIFDVIVNMNTEADSQPYWLAVIESNGFENISDIQDFIQFDSNIYPDLNELFENYLIENRFTNDSPNNDFNL